MNIIIKDLINIIIMINNNLEWWMIRIVLYHLIKKNENGGKLDIFIIIIILLILERKIFLVFLILESLLTRINLIEINREIVYREIYKPQILGDVYIIIIIHPVWLMEE